MKKSQWEITYIEDRGRRGISQLILIFSLYLLWSPKIWILSWLVALVKNTLEDYRQNRSVRFRQQVGLALLDKLRAGFSCFVLRDDALAPQTSFLLSSSSPTFHVPRFTPSKPSTKQIIFADGRENVVSHG